MKYDDGIIQDVVVTDIQSQTGPITIIRTLSSQNKSIIIARVPFKSRSWIETYKVKGQCDCIHGDEIILLDGGSTIKIKGIEYLVLDIDAMIEEVEKCQKE